MQIKKEPLSLVVIIRNDSPMIHCGDSPSYRSVTVRLTDAQCSQLARKWTGHSFGTDEFEEFSKAFLQVEEVEEWYCPRCVAIVSGQHVTSQEPHDPRCGGKVDDNEAITGFSPVDGAVGDENGVEG